MRYSHMLTHVTPRRQRACAERRRTTGEAHVPRAPFSSPTTRAIRAATTFRSCWTAAGHGSENAVQNVCIFCFLSFFFGCVFLVLLLRLLFGAALCHGSGNAVRNVCMLCFLKFVKAVFSSCLSCPSLFGPALCHESENAVRNVCLCFYKVFFEVFFLGCASLVSPSL